jgi:electron transfer flavoprotein alpha subunit
VLAELDRRGAPGAWIEHWETRPVPPAAGLEQAKFILAVGMGAGTKEKAAGLAGLAGAMGAELAVSRPVAMNAWASMDRLVGVSGAVTRAGVCIVAGASGSAAFMAGIEHGGFIVALNSDPAAPIFRCADLGAVGDCVAIVAELARLVRAGGGRP